METFLLTIIPAIITGLAFGLFFMFKKAREEKTKKRLFEEIKTTENRDMLMNVIYDIENFTDKSTLEDLYDIANYTNNKKYSYELFRKEKEFVIDHPNDNYFECLKCKKKITLTEKNKKILRANCSSCNSKFYWGINIRK